MPCAGISPPRATPFLCVDKERKQSSRRAAKPKRPRCLRPSLRCGAPAMLAPCDLAELATLRSAQTGGESQRLKRAVTRAPQGPVLLGEATGARRRGPRRARFALADAQASPHSSRYGGYSPSAPPRSTGSRGARLRASITDSHRLSEQSVAARVRGGLGIRASQGTPRISRGGAAGAVSLPTFLGAQESRSPAGAKSPHLRSSPPFNNLHTLCRNSAGARQHDPRRARFALAICKHHHT